MSTTTLDYALLAGSAYYSTRAEVNRFPIPAGWSEVVSERLADDRTGFEARTFQSGAEIVISYAGTYDKSGADIAADVDLFGGRYHAQLLQAARYYLDIKGNRGQTPIPLAQGPTTKKPQHSHAAVFIAPRGRLALESG